VGGSAHPPNVTRVRAREIKYAFLNIAKDLLNGFYSEFKAVEFSSGLYVAP
jgi:hypothetical protein